MKSESLFMKSESTTPFNNGNAKFIGDKLRTSELDSQKHSILKKTISDCVLSAVSTNFATARSTYKSASVHINIYLPDALFISMVLYKNSIYLYSCRNHHDFIGFHAVKRFKNMTYHRFAANGHQHFGQLRFHACSLACAEHNGGDF